ncbi:hypothetical protein E2562_021959 [Oryza meyeriana var. granulata]|uniref:DUF834 domain-containing protein n=1 Tax=Oryza meyeriana var. granulata TaxID=110450 RepID=A0A6G1DLJ6_9ORYZ|nr:hypothetical protein E2562_021959 [Oryza meyeriana var. granulata]
MASSNAVKVGRCRKLGSPLQPTLGAAKGGRGRGFGWGVGSPPIQMVTRCGVGIRGRGVDSTSKAAGNGEAGGTALGQGGAVVGWGSGDVTDLAAGIGERGGGGDGTTLITASVC